MVEDLASVARLIGDRVRVSRTSAGWTLDELAGQSGVSRRMLVNIEQGTTNPSILTLLRLSDALGIGLPALVEPTHSQRSATAISRSGEGVQLWSSPTGGSAVMVIGTRPPNVCELWDWRLGPADVYTSEAHRIGTVELLHVLSGTVLLTTGESEYRLTSGDAARFAGDRPHAYGNTSATRSARFSLTVFEPVDDKEEQ